MPSQARAPFITGDVYEPGGGDVDDEWELASLRFKRAAKVPTSGL